MRHLNPWWWWGWGKWWVWLCWHARQAHARTAIHAVCASLAVVERGIWSAVVANCMQDKYVHNVMAASECIVCSKLVHAQPSDANRGALGQLWRAARQCLTSWWLSSRQAIAQGEGPRGRVGLPPSRQTGQLTACQGHCAVADPCPPRRQARLRRSLRASSGCGPLWRIRLHLRIRPACSRRLRLPRRRRRRRRYISIYI